MPGTILPSSGPLAKDTSALSPPSSPSPPPSSPPGQSIENTLYTVDDIVRMHDVASNRRITGANEPLPLDQYKCVLQFEKYLTTIPFPAATHPEIPTLTQECDHPRHPLVSEHSMPPPNVLCGTPLDPLTTHAMMCAVCYIRSLLWKMKVINAIWLHNGGPVRRYDSLGNEIKPTKQRLCAKLWTTLKVRLENLVTRLEKMADDERRWEEAFGDGQTYWGATTALAIVNANPADAVAISTPILVPIEVDGSSGGGSEEEEEDGEGTGESCEEGTGPDPVRKELRMELNEDFGFHSRPSSLCWRTTPGYLPGRWAARAGTELWDTSFCRDSSFDWEGEEEGLDLGEGEGDSAVGPEDGSPEGQWEYTVLQEIKEELEVLKEVEEEGKENVIVWV